VVLETVILFAGFVVLALLRVPIAFALLVSSLVVFLMTGRLQPWTLTQNIYAGLDSFVLLAVPFFILAGSIMNEAKATDRLLRLANAMVGFVRGGLGMVNVAVSMAFAGISGSSTADTAGVGTILIPQMRKRGYPVEFSVAVTAASSVMGSIIPPSILMVVWGAYTNTSIGALFLGGIIPGAMIGFTMMGIVYVTARRHDYPREDRIHLREVGRAFWESLLALGVPLVVIGGIVLGIVTATEASVLAVLYALILGLLVYRTLRIRDLPRVFRDSARLAALSLFALAAASVFAYLLGFYRIPFALQGVIGDLPPALLLPFIALLWLTIGTFMDALPAMAIMIPVFDPIIEATGLDPVHYGVVSVVALSIGLITPPYGLCLLLASAIAGIPATQALRSLLPFFVAMVVIVVVLVFIPGLVLWLPNLLQPASGQ
jgi:tripartite ATP-independent transporter DctM subunit